MSADGVNSLPLQDVLQLRTTHWDTHPVVASKAILPSPAVLFVLAVVKRIARRQRKSVAFWAHPLTGKSFCIEMLVAYIASAFPGAGSFLYEAKAKEPARERKQDNPRRRSFQAKEREFLGDILEAMDYEPGIRFELSRRRSQVQKALLALASIARHLFIIVDEAQELDEQEMTWLKSIINWLSKRGVRVTVVMFGQVELLATREQVEANFRSDLGHRYTHEVYQFPSIQAAGELAAMIGACDDPKVSEWPRESGLCYTHFLFPRAFGSGFRLQSTAQRLWKAFMAVSPLRDAETGLSAGYVADALAELVDLLREHDDEGMVVLEEHLVQAVKNTGYATRSKLRSPESVT